ncbi:MAG: hypothetical protein M0Q53_07420 [Prolixibacteraceae bacterium]|jgi:hypothetical protein|nr:hypothetical protein [Prolixibacteraceae bacterium]
MNSLKILYESLDLWQFLLIIIPLIFLLLSLIKYIIDRIFWGSDAELSFKGYFSLKGILHTIIMGALVLAIFSIIIYILWLIGSSLYEGVITGGLLKSSIIISAFTIPLFSSVLCFYSLISGNYDRCEPYSVTKIKIKKRIFLRIILMIMIIYGFYMAVRITEFIYNCPFISDEYGFQLILSSIIALVLLGLFHQLIRVKPYLRIPFFLNSIHNWSFFDH